MPKNQRGRPPNSVKISCFQDILTAKAPKKSVFFILLKPETRDKNTLCVHVRDVGRAGRSGASGRKERLPPFCDRLRTPSMRSLSAGTGAGTLERNSRMCVS